VAQKNVVGLCALCRKQKTLCKSHYLGRALYELSRVDGEHPVVMTRERVEFTPRQIWAHLLCRDCEDLFDKNGEKTTFRWINRGKDKAVDFPLLNRMELAMPLKQDGNSIVYSGFAIGVPTEAFAYFALSLLWRGAAHKWKTLKHQTTSVELGRYEEPIRRYLLGEAGFPDNVYVLLGVCTDFGSQGLVFPPHEASGARYKTYSFLVRGIWFNVITDDKAKGIEGLCCVKSPRKVLHLENCEQRVKHALSAFKDAKEIDKRLKEPKQKK